MVWVADNRLDDNQTFSVHIYDSIYREYTSNTCAWHLKQHSCNVPFFISAKWSLAITTPLQTQFIIQYTIYHALWQVYQSKVTLNWEFTRELVTIKGYNIFFFNCPVYCLSYLSNVEAPNTILPDPQATVFGGLIGFDHLNHWSNLNRGCLIKAFLMC